MTAVDDRPVAPPAERTRRGVRLSGRAGSGQLYAIAFLALLVGGIVVLVALLAVGVFPATLRDRPTFTFQYVVDVFTGSRFVTDALYSLVVAAVAVVLGAGTSILMAVLLARSNMPGAKRALLAWTPVSTLFVPGIVVFFAWIVMYSPRAGIVNVLIRDVTGSTAENGPLNIVSLPGFVLAMAVFLLPIAYLIIKASVDAVPPELEDAASMAGAGWFRTMRTVTVPLIRPAVAAASLICFALAMGVFVVPTIIRVPGYRTLSIHLYRAVTGENPDMQEAAVIGTLLMLLGIVGVVLRHRWVGNVTYAASPRAGAGQVNRPTLVLGRGGRWVAATGVLLFLLVTVAVPLLGVLLVALTGAWSPNISLDMFGLDSFREISSVEPRAYLAFGRSIVLALVGASIGTVIGLWLAMKIKTGGRRGRIIEMLSFLPSGIPTLVIGFAGLVVSVRFLPEYRLFWILVAYLVISLPFSTQLGLSALHRIPGELLAASAMAGASALTTVRRILMPLISKDLLALWFLLSLIMLREVEASVLVAGAGTPVAGPTVLTLWQSGTVAGASAYGVLILLVTIGFLLVSIVLQRIVRAAGARSRG